MGLKDSGLRGSLRNVGSVLPAFFDVTITNTNSPVSVGDILTVDYSANNTGDVQDTQDIRLEIDSVQEDVDTNVTLTGNTSTTGTLQWDTTNESTADYTATVLSNDDSDTVTVTVESAIPDSGLLHNYDWNDGATTTSTVPDLEGGDDLTGAFTDLSATINGVQAGTFDGTDDSVDGVFTTSLPQPIEVFSVSQSADDGDIQIVTTGTNSNNIVARQTGTDDTYQLNAGSNLTGGTPSTNPEILTTRFDGASSLVRVNSTEVISGNPGLNGMVGLIVSRGDLPVNGAVGQVMVYDPTASGYSRTDVEQYLADKWGITL